MKKKIAINNILILILFVVLFKAEARDLDAKKQFFQQVRMLPGEVINSLKQTA